MSLAHAQWLASSTPQYLARYVNAHTGIPVSVILAQMADETGYGTSYEWNFDKNPSGMTMVGGGYWHFSTWQQAAQQYANQYLVDPAGYYTNILQTARSTHNAIATAKALGQSAWAQGHYIGFAPYNYPGGALVSIIQQYDLTKYDKTTSPPPTTTKKPSSSGGAVTQAIHTVEQHPVYLFLGAGMLAAAGYFGWMWYQRSNAN